MAYAFTDNDPSLESHWRALILFGRNVASYKFALGKSLLELSHQDREVVSLEELAGPFSRHVCEHLKGADKQGTSARSKFLDACRSFNRGEISEEQLVETTARLGFVNVIDAFHVLPGDPSVPRFFVDERKNKTGGIRLTENVPLLRQSNQFTSLPAEVEARWRLVETAWELNLPRQLVSVSYDPETDLLFPTDVMRRRAITRSRDALNGYQKGRCFYCFGEISVDPGSPTLAQVDHFFPHILKGHGIAEPNDGVWNLVLACQRCNGAAGKSALVPSLAFVERLHTRNEFLISSHHPLRETLMLQTGALEHQRGRFLERAYQEAKELLVGTWDAPQEGPPAF